MEVSFVVFHGRHSCCSTFSQGGAATAARLLATFTLIHILVVLG